MQAPVKPLNIGYLWLHYGNTLATFANTPVISGNDTLNIGKVGKGVVTTPS